MTDEIEDIEDRDDGEEQAAFQTAENMYIVRGNVNYFLSEYKGAKDGDLSVRLEQARNLLESKKEQLFEAVKRSGWNSKDAKSLVEDCSLYRDQVVAVKQTFAMRSAELPSHRLDAESLGQAVQRHFQIEENLRQQEVSRMERARLEEQQRAQAEAAEQARIQEEERQRDQERTIGCIVKGAMIVIGICLLMWLLVKILEWITAAFRDYPITFSLIVFGGSVGIPLFIAWLNSEE
jgi:hypothetical protein